MVFEPKSTDIRVLRLLGFGGSDLGFGFQGFRCLGFRVSDLGVWVSGVSGFGVQGLRFRVSDLGFFFRIGGRRTRVVGSVGSWVILSVPVSAVSFHVS